MMERSRQRALDYARPLPDFICSEAIRRYIEMRQRGAWVPTGQLTIKLSYFKRVEHNGSFHDALSRPQQVLPASLEPA